MALYFCKNCGQNVDEPNPPRPQGCSCANNHTWIKVSGKTRWYCRNCHLSVYSDAQPYPKLAGGCNTSSMHAHSWAKA